MLANLRVPLGWKDLLKRSLKEALADNIFDLSAQQAYYFFFSLFPALLFVIAVASFFPLQGLIDNVIEMIGRIAPSDVVKIITDSMKSLSEQNSGGILTFAFLVTIWSSSGAMVSIITTRPRGCSSSTRRRISKPAIHTSGTPASFCLRSAATKSVT